MTDSNCVRFLQWALPQLGYRWPGFRKVRRQVCRRISKRWRDLELLDWSAYQQYLGDHPDEWKVLDSFCRISISRFYRDRGVFDLVRQTVLPHLAATALRKNETVVRCWCLGCASGEEPYSLMLMWKKCVQPQYPNIELRVIGSDSDSQMLDRASRAVYPASSLKDLPRDWIDSSFTRQTNAERVEQFRLNPEYQLGVRFVCQDVRHGGIDGPFQTHPLSPSSLYLLRRQPAAKAI